MKSALSYQLSVISNNIFAATGVEARVGTGALARPSRAKLGSYYTADS
jgi:hypothetical protein